MATDYFLYEIPIRSSPLGKRSRSFIHPYDNFDSLTRSMRELTRYADHIARTLADPEYDDTSKKRSIADKQQSRTHQPASSQVIDHLLRPSIDWKETADAFVLTAATPGLRKDELKVELLEDAGAWYIEVAGQTAASSDAPKHDTQTTQPQPKPRDVRTTYRSFSEKVRLPPDADPEAMQATYEDGLLVVTMPRAKAETAKRRTIAIN